MPAGVDLTRRRRRSAWPTARRTTCCARWPRCSRARSSSCSGAGGGVGLATVQLGARSGARVTAVASSGPRSWRSRRPRAQPGLIDHRAGDLRAALRETLPERRRRGGRPGGRRPVGAGAAGAALGRPVRDGRLRLGRDPAHPAQPGAAQGHAGSSASSSCPSPRTPPTRSAATRPSWWPSSPRAGSAPHIGATFPLDDDGRRPPPGRRRPGDRQGRRRRVGTPTRTTKRRTRPVRRPPGAASLSMIGAVGSASRTGRLRRAPAGLLDPAPTALLDTHGDPYTVGFPGGMSVPGLLAPRTGRSGDRFAGTKRGDPLNRGSPRPP